MNMLLLFFYRKSTFNNVDALVGCYIHFYMLHVYILTNTDIVSSHQLSCKCVIRQNRHLTI